MDNMQSDSQGTEFRDELEGLRRRVHDLEARQADSGGPRSRTYRRAFSRGVAVGLASTLALALAAGLLYGQNAVQALFIDPQGRVGIGTTSPSAPLDVKGAGDTTIALKATGRIQSVSPSGGVWLNDAADGLVGSNGGNIGFWTSGGQWNFQIQKTTGRVGIGTDSPNTALQVDGSEIHSGGAGAGYSFANRNTQSFVASPGAGERWVWYAQDARARLWSGSDKLSIDAAGSLVANRLQTNGLQIGNTAIGEGELQILRKLAAGQLVIDMYNTAQGEYLYAADCCSYDNSRRSVFTWRPKGRVSQGAWQLQVPR